MREHQPWDRKIAALKRALKKKGLEGLRLSREGQSIRLQGETESWEEKVRAGYTAAGRGFKGVLNDITVRGVDEPEMSRPELRDEALEGRQYDVIIIGAGVIGCAAARELSRWNLSVGVLEKEKDAAKQASGRNDGMIHPGFAASPGSLKAAYNTRGNRMYDQWAEELDLEFQRPGSLLLYRTPFTRLLAPYFRYRCRKNGVDGRYRSLSAKEVRRMEPHVTDKQYGAFFMPSAGIVSPYRVTLALAENAAANGCRFHFDTVLEGIEGLGGVEGREGIDEPKAPAGGDQTFGVKTNRGTLKCRVLINAAGVWADRVASMAGDRFFSIHGRKGTDAILDKSCGVFQTRIAGMPRLLGSKNSHSKGGGVVPCVEGNILLGPTAEEVPHREDYSTDKKTFDRLLEQLSLNKKLESRHIINYYSGVRAATWEEDFILGPSEKNPRLIHAAGIQSPGLASAPAIAEDLAQWTVEALESAGRRVVPNEGFNPRRKDIPRVKDLSREERDSLIKKDPAYGEILCRCEEVSRGEIRDALGGALPARTVDGVKRRVRAGAGRCHGGFCLPRVITLMAREMGVHLKEVTKKGPESPIILEETKQEVQHEG